MRAERKDNQIMGPELEGPRTAYRGMIMILVAAAFTSGS